MPRSASTWLGRTLASHPEIALFGESDYWGRSYIEPSPNGAYDRGLVNKVVTVQADKDWAATTGDEQGALPGLLAGQYGRLVATAARVLPDPATPRSLYLAICMALSLQQKKSVVVDKTPGHLLFLQRIESAFPDSRCVVVSREPLGFIASLTHRKEGRPVHDQPWLRRLAYHPALTVLLWRRYARAMLALQQQPRHAILLLDYSDIQKDPGHVLARVCTHLGVDPTRLRVANGAANSGVQRKTRGGLPPATGHWLRILAKRELRSLYPEVSPPPTTLVAVAISWLLLVPGMLAFCLYAPRPTHWFKYLLNIIRAGHVRIDKGRAG